VRMRLFTPLLVGAVAARLAASAGLAAAADEIVIRGRAVCLDESGQLEAAGSDCPDQPTRGWAIETPDGTLHRLSPDDERVAMLGDPRVRSRELEITAWRYEGGRLAIVHLYSVIDGRRHDPHYYCPVCAIRANTPGLCWCCRRPFEFREPLVGEESTTE